MTNVFAIPVFFICFRECLETVIIVSVLLSWLKGTLGGGENAKAYKKFRRQIWWGILAGLGICLCIGAAFIAVFYTIGSDYFAKTEDLWEGIFSLIASLIITLMGAALLRVSKMQEKWRVKLARSLAVKDQHLSGSGKLKRWSEKYAMFLLPFVTVLREGLEAVVFIGGVSLGLPATAFPLAVVCGLAAGILIGYVIYKGGNFTPLQIFLIISTCVLYLVGAGLFSKSIWLFQNYKWSMIIGGDAAEIGSGAGSYDVRQSVWHVNCCNPEINGGGGWGVFNSLLGWQNSATYGSVIGYNMYWIAVMAGFLLLRYQEVKGHWPLMKAKQSKHTADLDSDQDETGVMSNEKANVENGLAIRETGGSSSDGSPPAPKTR